MPGPSARIVWRGDAALAAIDEALARGENQAVERLLAIVTPFTPFLEGDLTRDYGIHQATASTAHEGAQLQNSSAYAVYQHEGGDGKRVITRHTTADHPQARTKFVEVPMRDARTELYGIVGQAVRDGLA
jgi:hypothetical protein